MMADDKIELGKLTKSYKKKAELVPRSLRRYFFCFRRIIHGTALCLKLDFRKSRPSCIFRRKRITRKGRTIEIPFMAWYAVLRLLDVARRVMRYTNVQMGPPEVAINVEIKTWIGPRLLSKYSFDPSRAAAADVGYSPPTPTPAIPRAIIRNQSMFFAGETWKTRVESREPMTTKLDVISIPLFRENRSEAYPRMRIPTTEPMRRALEMRVWNVAVYTLVPRRWFITTLVLDAWASQQTATYSGSIVSILLNSADSHLKSWQEPEKMLVLSTMLNQITRY